MPSRLAIPEDFASRADEKNAALCERYKITDHTVVRWRRYLGLSRPRCVTKPVPDDFREVAPGKSLTKLRHHYHAGEATIARWRKECGIPPESNTLTALNARRAPMPDDLADRYRELGSICKLEKHYGRDFNTVRRWLVAAGLSINPSGWPATLKPRRSKPAHPHVRMIPGHVVLPAFRNSIPPAHGGREEEAAQFLRHIAAVYRCTERGGADQKGSHWRFGNAVMTPAEMIARAERKGWRPDSWKEIAA